jgi:hypothetical protein
VSDTGFELPRRFVIALRGYGQEQLATVRIAQWRPR